MTDLISRQALKNALTDWQMEYAEKGKDVERFETLGAVIDLVEQLPTIEPKPSHDWNGWENGCGRTYDFEPKRGKWINDKGLYRCSVCNNLWTAWWATVMSKERMYKEMKFCPNCGARMTE